MLDTKSEKKGPLIDLCKETVGQGSFLFAFGPTRPIRFPFSIFNFAFMSFQEAERINPFPTQSEGKPL